MYETEIYEPDAEFEQALSAALARESAPPDLIAGVMSRVEASLLDAQPTSAVPSFRVLSFPARSRWSSLWSIGAHAAVFALIALLLYTGQVRITSAKKLAATLVDVKPFMPMTLKLDKSMGGGGGGGAHEAVEASKGRLPRIARTQITPPQIVHNDNPKLAVAPTIIMSQQIKLPDANLPNIGVPQSPQVSLASQGSGADSGFGNSHGGGIGSGNGQGVGPGLGSGYGGGVMRPGGGVSAPQVIYSVDPEFSDEARRAKYQGVCVVGLIVDAQGNPQHVRVVRPLGMGLDEKAIAAVKQYRFKPSYYQGRPAAVEVNIEVNFRIY
jgi:periplasmic protein TonB